MKAHEAIAILESLDPSREVTLTIGAATPKDYERMPNWKQTAPYVRPPNFWTGGYITSTKGTIQ